MMNSNLNIHLDNFVIRELCKNDLSNELWDSLLDLSNQNNIPIENKPVRILSDWMLFLEFIGLGSILQKYQVVIQNETLKFFNELLNNKNLTIDTFKPLVDHLYDISYIDCEQFLETKKTSLRKKANEQLKFSNGLGAKLILPITFDPYLEVINDESSTELIDLHLHLSWHRMFQYINIILSNRNPLIESTARRNLYKQLLQFYYYTIKQHSTVLNFYRLINSAYFHESQHSDYIDHIKSGNDIIKIESHKIKSYEDLVDCTYLDYGIFGNIELQHNNVFQSPVKIFTTDSPEQVFTRLQFSRTYAESLFNGVDNWDLKILYQNEIVCIEKIGNKFQFVQTIQHKPFDIIKESQSI